MTAPPQSMVGALNPGAVGLGATFVDIGESLPDLMYPLSNMTYNRMRRDPQLAAILSAYTLPLRAASYHVDPAGCRDEVVQQNADDLGLPILGVDPEPGPARRRGVLFDTHLRLALLMLTFGHMCFEMQADVTSGQARLIKLEERMPLSIVEIELTDGGGLAGIRQDLTEKPIPANRLVWYAHEKEGAAWQGQSMLRPAFSAWLLKHELWRVLTTSDRRFGWGVPEVETPPNPTPAQVAEAQRLASGFRVGEEAGAGMPSGFRFKLTGLSGSAPDVLAHIRYFDQQMAQSVLASVLNLDASPNGSRALGETLVGLLELSWQATATEITDPLTALSVQLVDWNWGEDEPAPRIVAGDVGSRPEITAQAISQLMASGAIAADPELEAWTRERWRLPAKGEEPEPPPEPLPPVLVVPPDQPLPNGGQPDELETPAPT